MSVPRATMPRMEPLFSTAPIRRRAPRRERWVAILGPRWFDPWPPPDRDPEDPALAATRLLATAGRMETRLRYVAREHGVDRRIMRFLLLFAERKAALRVTDVAENMGISRSTASRIVTRTLEAGLVDLLHTSERDGREVSVHLTVAGRDAAIRCLRAIRADAADVGTQAGPVHRGWSGAYGIRWYLKNAAPMDEGWMLQGPP
jgi:DNA-binding MarR family transcriptional regulator